VPLQNGVEAADQLAGVLGAGRVLGGMCRTLSFLVGPGRIRSVGKVPTVTFGEQDNPVSERAQRPPAAFQRAGIQASIPPDIRVALWQKLLMVVSLGGVGAVTQKPIGAMLADPATRDRIRRAMGEIAAVARARGAALPEDSVEKAMAFVDT